MAGGAAAGAGLAGLTLVGCGDDDSGGGKTPAASSPAAGASAAASPAAAAPKKGGELVLGSGTPSTQSLDPQITLNLSFTHWSLITNKLISPDHKKLEPLQGELIEKWEQPDKSTLLFTVRQGVKFHEGHGTNGRAFTAEDVAFNLMRIAAKLPQDEKRKAAFQRSGTLQGMDKAEAVDEKTVKVTFATPNSQFLNGVADWRNWPVPKEVVDKDPDFKDPKNFSGTGPFMVDSWDATQAVGKYVANPNYWKKGQPYLASIQQVLLPDAAASMAAFLSGKTTYVDAMADDRRQTIQKSKPDAKIVNWEHTGWEYVRLNQSRDMFKDPRVRRAMFLGLNLEEMMVANYGKGFFDLTGPLVSGFPGTWSSDDVKKLPGWANQTVDITEAKKLLEAAGFPDGKGITFQATPFGTSGPWYDNAIYAKDQLEKAFPQIKIQIRQTSDTGEFSRWLAGGDYDLIAYGSFPPPSAVLEANLHYRTGGSRNYTKFSDPDVDRLIDNSLTEFDNTARAKLMGELQQRLLDNIFAIPIGKRRGVFAQQPYVRGFEEWVGVGTFESYNPAFSCDSVWFAT
jgi:peptide/nickel transport system substrate-binding protein